MYTLLSQFLFPPINMSYLHLEMLSAPFSRAVVLKLWSVDPKGSVTSSQGICGYISVKATLKFTYLFN